MADTPDTPPVTKPRRRSAADATPPAPVKTTSKRASAAVTPNPVKTKHPPKPRSTKRSAPASVKQEQATGKREETGGKFRTVAVAGGVVAAVGAAAAALLTLRGSTRGASTDKSEPIGRKDHAHQPDGTDSSRSFQAGIADESTIPE